MRIEIANIKRFFRQCDKSRSSLAAHIVGSIVRTLLAATFLFSGFVKSVDPLGTVYKVEDYLTAMSLGSLLPAAGFIAVTLIVAEWILGWLMLFNVRTKWTAWGTLVFMLIMTPLTLWIALTGAVHDCGCFGDALVLTNWQTFWKNVVLLSLVFILLYCKKGIPQLFSWWAELALFLVGLGITAGIMGYGYTHLPIIDFRPYKVGNNIYEMMYPKPDAIVVKHTMKKDGQYRVFSNEEYMAAKADGWVWDSQNTFYYRYAGSDHHLEPMSVEPVITDFILNMWICDSDIDEIDETKSERYTYLEDNGDEKDYYTKYILTSEEPITLIVMYDLNKRNHKQAVRAAQLYKKIRANGGECYFLTGSGDEALLAYADEVGIDINEGAFLYMDATPAKTIIRANPGVVVIQNGVIISKSNMRQVKI